MHALLALALCCTVHAGPPLPQAFSSILEGPFTLSADGKRIYRYDQTVWDVPGRKLIFSESGLLAHALATSGDGKWFAYGGNYSIFRIVDTRTNKVHWDLTLWAHGDTIITHVAFTPDNRHLISLSANGIMAVWDVIDKKPISLFLFPVRLKHNQDSQQDFLRSWRVLNGAIPPHKVKTFVQHKLKIEVARHFSIHSDGKILALPTGYSEVVFLEVASGKIVSTIKTEQETTMRVCYSRNGKMLAIGAGSGDDLGYLGKIELWDVAKEEKIKTLKAHRHSVRQLQFSPDDTMLASTGTVDGVRVWNVSTGKQLYHLYAYDRRGRDSYADCLAFTPDGKFLLTCGPDRSDGVFFHEAKTGKRLLQPLNK
jgi:WD40 repeat protein